MYTNEYEGRWPEVFEDLRRGAPSSKADCAVQKMSLTARTECSQALEEVRCRAWRGASRKFVNESDNLPAALEECVRVEQLRWLIGTLQAYSTVNSEQ
jgi:hypothetical protein